jgi:hypothetical protein
MKSVKNLIPNMHGPIGFLSNAFNLYFEQRKVDPPAMIPLLAAIFETALSSHCTHEKTSWEYIDRALTKLIPEYTGTSPEDELMLEYVVDPTYTWAMEYLLEMKVDRWESWIVTVGKSGVIILQCMGDYRVLEWERLVREGVITPPAHVVSEKRPGPIRSHVVASRPRIKETPKITINERDNVSLSATKPLGYRIYFGGKPIVRTTLAELQEILGMQFDQATIGQLHTFGLRPENCYPIMQNGRPIAYVEVLWREDRAMQHLQLKQAIKRMALEMVAPECALANRSFLEDPVEKYIQ